MERIIIVHHTNALGGGTKSLIDVVKMLVNDYEVLLCIPKGMVAFKNELEKIHIEIIEIDGGIPHLLGFSGSPSIFSKGKWESVISICNIRKFCKKLEEYHPDIVIFNSIVTSISAVFLNKRILKICVDRETLTNKFYLFMYRHILNNYMQGVCFLAEYERKKLNLTRAETLLLPDAVAEEDIHDTGIIAAREEEGLSLDDYVVLYMGGSSLIKGPDIILSAMNRIPEPCKLIVAGTFNEEVISLKSILKHIVTPQICWRLIRLRKAYRIAERKKNMIIVGNRENVSSLLNSADIVVFPSVKVHQPRPCIEAGYYGKPVIISDYQETKEYFIKDYNALTFSPGNYNDLADRIVYAMNHKDEMKVMGENNRKMSVRYHDYNKISHDLCCFINRIVSKVII